MNTPARHQLLKIFTGPHAGAEVLLGDGEHVIGSDDNVDIILKDHLVRPKHVRVTINDAQVSCATFESAGLLIDGASVTSGELSPFQYFTLGSTHLAIGPADEEWPVANFPEFRLGGSPEQTEAIEHSVALEAASSDETPIETKRQRSPLSLILIPLLMLVFGGFYAMVSGGSNVEASAEPVASITTQVQAVLQNAKIPDGTLQLEVTDRGFLLSGYVPTKDIRKQITTDVRAISRSVSVRVRDNESMLKMVSDSLARRKLPFAVKLGEQPGAVVVEGVTRDLTEWTIAKERLPRDVPYVDSIIDKVTLPKVAVPRQPVIVAAATESPHAKSVAMDSKGEALDPLLESILKKVIPEKREPLLATGDQSEKPRSSTEKPATPTLANIPRQQLPDDVQIPLAYQSVSIGDTKFITMEDGERLFLGAKLSNGYSVTDILPDRIVVANGQDQRIHFLEAQ